MTIVIPAKAGIYVLDPRFRGDDVMPKKQGKLIVISAPSGCGKTTIVERLLEHNQDLTRSISYTTRAPRPGEVNGRDYFFISDKEFSAKERSGFFLESANVFGQSYGTSKEFVTDRLSQGLHVVLAIDVQGMKQLRGKVGPEFSMTSIFIMPPSVRALRARLENRKTETKPEIDERLEIAKKEMAAQALYDFVVVNRKVDQAVKTIEGIVK